jgi:hypothetical protein
MQSFSWNASEPGSRLSRLEARAFSETGLISIHLPASVSVIGSFCFSGCGSLTSITFDHVAEFCGNAAALLARLPLGETDLREATALLDD